MNQLKMSTWSNMAHTLCDRVGMPVSDQGMGQSRSAIGEEREIGTESGPTGPRS